MLRVCVLTYVCVCVYRVHSLKHREKREWSSLIMEFCRVSRQVNTAPSATKRTVGHFSDSNSSMKHFTSSVPVFSISV